MFLSYCTTFKFAESAFRDRCLNRALKPLRNLVFQHSIAIFISVCLQAELLSKISKIYLLSRSFFATDESILSALLQFCCRFESLNMALQPLHLHLWIPALNASKGGIQVYSAALLKALRSIAPSSQLEVFLKQDWPAPNSQYRCFGRYPARLRTAAFALALARSSLRHPPDLIISTHVNFAPVALALKQLCGVPYWVAAHGIDVWDLKNPLRQMALQQADRILAVSSTTRDRLLQQNLPADRVVVLPCTVDADRFTIAPKPNYLLRRYNLLPDQPVILTVARLESIDRAKGYDQILHALPQIRRAIPQVRYLLVGTGGDRLRIERLIDALQVQSNVTLAGLVSTLR